MSLGKWRAGLMSRPGQFMILGGLVAMCASFGSTMAGSLFLANAGAEALPVYYMLFAVLAVPVSVLFSGAIDRWPRRLSMAALLLLYGAGTTVCAALVGTDSSGYYLLYVVAGVCEMLMYSVYYILFGDYFTVTESKRHSGVTTVSLGVGAACGALLLSAVSGLVGPKLAFLALPLLVALTVAHLRWLTRREAPLDELESGAEEGLIDSLKAIPALTRHYPIVWLMAAAMFANVTTQCLMEYQAFSLYAQAFPTEREMTAFLGRMTAAVDVVGIAIVFLVTNPLLPRLGVAKMNLIPPAINLASFLLLVAWPGLATGILAHLNYYPLEHSLNVPAFALIYNAVPYSFSGRVRVINDGIVYPLAQIASGLLLMMLEKTWPLAGIALLGVVVAAAYLAAQWGTGREYLRSLMKMLRTGFIDLEKVAEGLRLPDEYGRDIRAMLAADDQDTIALGLELALRSDIDIPFDDLERALPLVPERIGLATLSALAQGRTTNAVSRLRHLAASPHPVTAALAWETLLTHRMEHKPANLAALLSSPHERLRSVAAAGMVALGSGNTDAHDVLHDLAEEGCALTALRILNALVPDERSSVLAIFRHHSAATVRAHALSLTSVTSAKDEDALRSWAKQAMADPDADVRAAALMLKSKILEDAELIQLCAKALEDTAPAVRRAACTALGQRGGRALDLLTERLASTSLERAEEAIDGIAKAGAQMADTLLFAHFTTKLFPAVERNAALLRQLPAEDAGWRPLRVAVADDNARCLHLALHALTALGYTRVIGVVRSAMRATDPRTRANALETLSSLAHRQYVLPLLPLFDDAPTSPPIRLEGEAARTMLDDLMHCGAPFLSAAARCVRRAVLPDPSPPRDEERLMNRLLFLKSVPLFAELSLDHLMAVDSAMSPEQFLPGETIVTEGESGNKLYIVLHGTVAVRKRQEAQERELARLGTGEVFGEMSLFDDERRSASVVAATEVQVLGLDGGHFNSLAHQLPEIPLKLCKVLSARLRAVSA